MISMSPLTSASSSGGCSRCGLIGGTSFSSSLSSSLSGGGDGLLAIIMMPSSSYWPTKVNSPPRTFATIAFRGVVSTCISSMRWARGLYGARFVSSAPSPSPSPSWSSSLFPPSSGAEDAGGGSVSSEASLFFDESSPDGDDSFDCGEEGGSFFDAVFFPSSPTSHPSSSPVAGLHLSRTHRTTGPSEPIIWEMSSPLIMPAIIASPSAPSPSS
mmetsp:Transcript_55800/g.167237  ORF Transcript_55800/g.167237 Transcript_55800/m.167237 type:complete len:214 (-) Transcript_55800:136-777(-)